MAVCRIRLAAESDIANIRRFLDMYWKRGHILARDREMLVWQYSFGKPLSMVLGIDEEQKIQGILGFIPYECEDGEFPDLCLALWKANPGHAFLGMRLLLFLKQQVRHRHIFCVGINLQTTKKIYEDFGFFVRKMRQWYRLRPQLAYRIANVVNTEIPNIEAEQLSLRLLQDDSELENMPELFCSGGVPYKSSRYVKKRYVLHPRYMYELYLAERAEGEKLLLVMRWQLSQGAVVLRLVDCIGDVSLLPGCSAAMDGLLARRGAEYVDLYEAGLPEELLYRAGYLPVEESGNIIPNYFQPYLRENISIYYAADTEGMVLFRGDGDQDRPNA